MIWTKPVVMTYDEAELIEKMSVKAQTHDDSHLDDFTGAG